MQIRRVHHLTIAVRDVSQASTTFGGLFGATAGEPADVAAFGVKSADADLAGLALQYVAPADADSALTRFLERRGEGLYNIALEVDDLAAAVAELRERGVRVSDPVEAPPGFRSAFIAMAATHGLSVQLVEVGGETSATGVETAVAKPDTGQEPDATPADETALRDLRPDEWEEWSDTD